MIEVGGTRMSTSAAKIVVLAIIFLTSGSLAFGQAGSTGGTLGKTGKSLSGEENPAEPSARTKSRTKSIDRDTSSQPSGVSVTGRWRWSADCTVGHWQGEFDLAEASRGRFNGSFAGTSVHDVGTISDGSVNGGSISFTRTSSIATQYWRGRLAGTRMKGTSTGNANCSWQATRK